MTAAGDQRFKYFTSESDGVSAFRRAVNLKDSLPAVWEVIMYSDLRKSIKPLSAERTLMIQSGAY